MDLKVTFNPNFVGFKRYDIWIVDEEMVINAMGGCCPSLNDYNGVLCTSTCAGGPEWWMPGEVEGVPKNSLLLKADRSIESIMHDYRNCGLEAELIWRAFNRGCLFWYEGEGFPEKVYPFTEEDLKEVPNPEREEKEALRRLAEEAAMPLPTEGEGWRLS